MNREREAIFALMRSLNHINSCYNESVKKYDMKESELWLMYALSEGGAFSQKQICDEWMVPRTTLNAIVKNWQKEGYITLTPIPGKRREMTICMTKSGKRRADVYLRKLFRMEVKAMKATLQLFSATFIEAVQFFEHCLKENYEKEFIQKSDTCNKPQS